jgi:hypothetical protein
MAQPCNNPLFQTTTAAADGEHAACDSTSGGSSTHTLTVPTLPKVGALQRKGGASAAVPTITVGDGTVSPRPTGRKGGGTIRMPSIDWYQSSSEVCVILHLLIGTRVNLKCASEVCVMLLYRLIFRVCDCHPY